MKTLLVLLVSLLVSSAYATRIEQTVIKASNISFEQVECPSDAICFAVVKLQAVVTYKALGCLDDIDATAEDGGFTKDGKRILKLRAVNFHNPRSAKVKCFAQPRETFKFDLGMISTPEGVKIVEAKK